MTMHRVLFFLLVVGNLNIGFKMTNSSGKVPSCFLPSPEQIEQFQAQAEAHLK